MINYNYKPIPKYKLSITRKNDKLISFPVYDYDHSLLFWIDSAYMIFPIVLIIPQDPSFWQTFFTRTFRSTSLYDLHYSSLTNYSIFFRFISYISLFYLVISFHQSTVYVYYKSNETGKERTTTNHRINPVNNNNYCRTLFTRLFFLPRSAAAAETAKGLKKFYAWPQLSTPTASRAALFSYTLQSTHDFPRPATDKCDFVLFLFLFVPAVFHSLHFPRDSGSRSDVPVSRAGEPRQMGYEVYDVCLACSGGEHGVSWVIRGVYIEYGLIIYSTSRKMQAVEVVLAYAAKTIT